MELKDTVEKMLSSYYKERFKAEYEQLKIRGDKLSNMLTKYNLGLLEFTPTCPIELLEKQLKAMGAYAECLRERAEIEHIAL